MINYLQNLDLTSMAVKLGEHLNQDPELQAYCNKQFNKALTIIIGPDLELLPNEEDTPYVYINGLGKHEGSKQSKAEYEAMFSVGIHEVAESFSTSSKGVIVLDGSKKLTELMTLVQNALNSYGAGALPPDDVESVVLGRVGNSPDHWLGAISCVWELEIPLGRQVEF